ncbi:MAG: hypothetical protein CM1200mP18_04410 [Gammaproteobacteria bacterium]|nr:MAG: hypothetical protein CM1200mP18_04410 [Gammaproteobacteria bacterium]
MTGLPRAHTPTEAVGDDGEVFEAFEHVYAGPDYDNENSRLGVRTEPRRENPYYGFEHVDL